MYHITPLNWQPVILLKVNREPFSHKPNTLTLNRLYLAVYPDGVVCAGWDTPPAQRTVPQIRLVGWKPERDVLLMAQSIIPIPIVNTVALKLSQAIVSVKNSG